MANMMEYYQQISELKKAVRERELHRLELEKQALLNDQKRKQRHEDLKDKIKEVQRELNQKEMEAAQHFQSLLAQVDSIRREHQLLAAHTERLRQRKYQYEMQLMSASSLHHSAIHQDLSGLLLSSGGTAWESNRHATSTPVALSHPVKSSVASQPLASPIAPYSPASTSHWPSHLADTLARVGANPSVQQPLNTPVTSLSEQHYGYVQDPQVPSTVVSDAKSVVAEVPTLHAHPNVLGYMVPGDATTSRGNHKSPEIENAAQSQEKFVNHIKPNASLVHVPHGSVLENSTTSPLAPSQQNMPNLSPLELYDLHGHQSPVTSILHNHSNFSERLKLPPPSTSAHTATTSPARTTCKSDKDDVQISESENTSHQTRKLSYNHTSHKTPPTSPRKDIHQEAATGKVSIGDQMLTNSNPTAEYDDTSVHKEIPEKDSAFQASKLIEGHTRQDKLSSASLSEGEITGAQRIQDMTDRHGVTPKQDELSAEIHSDVSVKNVTEVNKENGIPSAISQIASTGAQILQETENKDREIIANEASREETSSPDRKSDSVVPGNTTDHINSPSATRATNTQENMKHKISQESPIPASSTDSENVLQDSKPVHTDNNKTDDSAASTSSNHLQKKSPEKENNSPGYHTSSSGLNSSRESNYTSPAKPLPAPVSQSGSGAVPQTLDDSDTDFLDQNTKVTDSAAYKILKGYEAGGKTDLGGMDSESDDVEGQFSAIISKPQAMAPRPVFKPFASSIPSLRPRPPDTDTDSVDSVEAAIQAAVNKNKGQPASSDCPKEDGQLGTSLNEPPLATATGQVENAVEPKADNAPAKIKPSPAAALQINLDSECESYEVSAGGEDSEDDDFDFYDKF